MRISDWSSDVCSSDLPHAPALFGFDRRDRFARDAVAAQAIVRIFEEAAEMIIIGARFGHDIDRAAGEGAVLDVERRELDPRVATRVIEERTRTPRRAVGVV